MVAITLIAGFLPKSPLLVGGAAAVVAFVCGLGGILGPRMAMIGVLTLVTFTLFSAVPSMPTTTVLNAALVGLGGLLVTIGPALVAGVRRLRPRAAAPALSDSPSPPARTPLTRATAERFARHAIRLSIATGVTMAAAIYSGLPHAYWLPMTVAWVSRPDASGSAHRVEARIVGTVLGLGVGALLILGLGVNGLGAALVIAVASGVTVAFIWANYPIGVGGITVVVIMLFALNGDNVETDIAVRLGSTLIAGVIVLLSSLLLRAPRPPSPL
jgi:MFS family permease